jgi:hypothetical protein
MGFVNERRQLTERASAPGETWSRPKLPRRFTPAAALARRRALRSSLTLSLFAAWLIAPGAAGAEEASSLPAASSPSAVAATSPDVPTAAADANTPPAEYERAIDRAVDEHERGHFEEAREHFREAHDVFPNARTLRGLGKAEFELRNYGESVRHLTAALTSTVRPLTPELRDEVHVLLERAKAYVGEVHVAVQPGSASVSVDGVTVAKGPRAALALLVGDHVLEFRATGRMPERRQIRVRGRDQINVQVVLSAPTLESASAPTTERREPMYKRWWVWTAAGVVAASVATAVALSMTRDADQGSVSGGTAGVVVHNP